MSRVVLEGEWTGYNSSQRGIVHRTVLPEISAKRFAHLHTIVFSDGTSLILHQHPVKRGEKIDVKDTYGSLIREASKIGDSLVLVADLHLKGRKL